MTDTFTAVPVNQPSGTVNFRLLTAQFGDGYKQVVPDGVNVKTHSWPLQFAGKKADMQALVDFFDAHVGISFYWTPPLGVEGLYQVTSYSPAAQGGDVYTVSATFEEHFAP